MRLFVALEIPPKVCEQLAMLIADLREAAGQSSGSGPRWVRPENLHLTLKFIGEVSAVSVAAICSTLAGVRASEPVALEFQALFFFPNDKKPQVLWAGIAGSAGLQALAASVERALEPIGIPREQRAFQPHLTLARFVPPGANASLRAAIGERADRVFGSLHATEFHLIKSKLRASGAEYTTVQSFPFTESEA
jgi:2'-5' RNA ligase